MKQPPSYGSTDNSNVVRKRAAFGRGSVLASVCALVVTVLLVSLHGSSPRDDAPVDLMGIQYGVLSLAETHRDQVAIDNMLKGKLGAAAHGVPSSVIAAAKDAARAIKEQQMQVKHEADVNLKKQAEMVNDKAQNLFVQAVQDQKSEDAAQAAQMRIAMQSEHARAGAGAGGAVDVQQ